MKRLDCHRDTEKNLRPHDQIVNMDWVALPNQLEMGKKLAAENHVRSAGELTSCSTCHR